MPGLARRISLFTASQIQELFKKSRLVYRCPGFDVRIAPAFYAYGRILIVTPKKMGNAPERNKARRRLKSLFYEEKLYTYRYDIIVFCKKEINTLTYSDLKEKFLDIIKSL